MNALAARLPAAPEPAPLLLHVFPSFATGGAQARFATLANRFGARYRHAIVAMDGRTECAERLAPNLAVSFPDPGLRKGNTIGNLRRIRRLLAALRPDLLVTSNWGSIEWAIANAVPLVPHLHMEDGFGPEERVRQLPRRVAVRRLFLRRSFIMLPSRVLLSIARDRWRLPPPRLRYIPNGIDLARYRPVETSKSPASGSRAFVVGTVAALRPEKNLPRLLAAFAHLRAAVPARLVVVGDGPERTRLESLTGALGIADSVRFAGHHPDPAPLYAEFDAFALSSDTEQMPLSVLEAMAAGLPVAATAVGDIAEMVAPGNHPFLTPLDERLLGEALLGLAHAPDLRRDLGRANRAKAEAEFDERRMVEAHAALIEEVLRRGGSHRVVAAADTAAR